MTYKPLLPFLTIKPSGIEGLGLFTSAFIKADTELGITHVYDERFSNGYIRTPLGGFFNHSKEPNCMAYIDNDFIKLKTIRDINLNEELTAKYWMYSLGKIK